MCVRVFPFVLCFMVSLALHTHKQTNKHPYQTTAKRGAGMRAVEAENERKK